MDGQNPDAITATTDASGHYSVPARAGPDLAVRYPGRTYVYPYQTRAIHVTVR